ncbi:cytochrome oxidase assembly protein 1 [Elasticomyces elasticus]|nr:cytochrome oxidase assembly protein 1 [Elasticomyces elasticus]
MTVSMLAIFNYQKSSSSIVSSTLYALRTNRRAREVLGDEIYFANKIPWIWGEMNQLHGRIDIQFWVKGTRAKALMRFHSQRKTRMGYFETLEWSLKTEDGQTIQLLQSEGADPFQRTPVNSVPGQQIV